MKINKKVLIPVFATAMGLSVIGGISGAVAWYQYNSKVTASYIGVSTADTGVLRIKEGSGSWTRAVDKGESNTLKPVTFDQNASHQFDTTKAWTTPEAGAGNAEALGRGAYYAGKEYVPATSSSAEELGYAGWLQADSSAFAQFDLYFDAYQTNAEEDSAGYTHVARPVFLSNHVIRCLKSDGTVDESKIADEAIRIQFDVLNSSNEITSQIITGKSASTTKMYGALDLDGSGTADKYHKTPFNDVTTGTNGLDGTEIEYGLHNIDQDVTAISSYNSASNSLFSTSGDENAPTHVRVTIWLEGWALLGSATRAEWNPFAVAGCDVQVGLEFTTGEFRGNDLSVIPNP